MNVSCQEKSCEIKNSTFPPSTKKILTNNTSEGVKEFRNRLGKNISKVLQLRIIGKGKGKETPYVGYIIETVDPFCLT